jgi:hypothetical protein
LAGEYPDRAFETWILSRHPLLPEIPMINQDAFGIDFQVAEKRCVQVRTADAV